MSFGQVTEGFATYCGHHMEDMGSSPIHPKTFTCCPKGKKQKQTNKKIIIQKPIG